MEILTFTLSLILILAAAALVFLFIIPFKFGFSGGYEDRFWVKFNIFCTPLLGLGGYWNSSPDKSLQLQIIAAGLSFGLNHGERKEKGKLGEKKGRGKKERNKKETKKQGKRFQDPLAVLHALDKELFGNLYSLLRDVLKMLRLRGKVYGRIGFSEPHFNGWLSALIGALNNSCKAVRLDIEPVWEEEHCEFSLALEGRVVVASLFFRIARFMLKRKTREFLKIMRKGKGKGKGKGKATAAQSAANIF